MRAVNVSFFINYKYIPRHRHRQYSYTQGSYTQYAVALSHGYGTVVMQEEVLQLKYMKQIIIIGIVGVAILTGIGYTYIDEPTEYVAPVQVATSTVEINNISEAQKQLNEAKRLLNEEEQKILGEIAERETRLEEIREVRLSFSQAPDQAN